MAFDVQWNAAKAAATLQKTMKTKHSEAPREAEDEMVPEYSLKGAVRGKYAKRYAEGTNLILLDPDVHAVFAHAEAVNSALRALAGIIRERTHAPAA